MRTERQAVAALIDTSTDVMVKITCRFEGVSNLPPPSCESTQCGRERRIKPYKLERLEGKTMVGLGAVTKRVIRPMRHSAFASSESHALAQAVS